MKAFVLCIILSFSSLQFAQGLYNFESIRFRSSKENVINQMMKVANTKLISKRDDVLGFTGGEYNSYKLSFWSFHFYKDQLHTVDIIFSKPDDINRLGENLIVYITNKYVKESLERLDKDWNLTNIWYFEDEKHIPIDLISLNLYETSAGETTYKLSFVNIKLFKEAEKHQQYNGESGLILDYIGTKKMVLVK